MIRKIRTSDSEQVCAIYNHYIEKTVITFEEQVLFTEELEKRINNIAADYPWLVLEEAGQILGYAYASKWKERSAYRFCVESTVYVDENILGKGLGRQLYEALLLELKSRNVHAVIAGVALPNERSQKLHERLGFEKVAHFKEVGYKFGQWIDVGYWELLL